ncbi:MAG: TRAP transporter substrate-binding protein [Hyphomicrobiaceae bacterium]
MDIKNMDRRELIRLLEAGAVTLGSLGIAGGALGQSKIFKVAYWMGPRHPLATKVLVPFAKQLNDSGLGFNAKVFGAGQVGGGGPPQAYQRMVNGISDVELHLPGYTSTQFPRTLVMEIPLQYESGIAATNAINRIFSKHLAQEYKGVKILGLFAIDVPVVMTNKVVRTPEDLKGLKLRTPSRNQADVIKGLGATPVGMPMPKTYNAIEKGVVDGAIVGISVVKSFKLAEVVKNYIIDLPFGYSPIIFGVNQKSYDALDTKQKAKFDELTKDWSMRGAESYVEEREVGIKIIKDRKDTNVTTLNDAERAKWIAKLETVKEGWIQKFEKQGLPYRQILKDYLADKA